ncbi:MAG: hypothetical protein WBC98_04280 [Candidatus Zixiibacteriota bacterium]
MKITMTIPSYWGREVAIGWKEGDAVYDHPSPLDEEGTLSRAVESIGVLNHHDFQLAIIAVPTSDDIAVQVEKKIANIIARSSRSIGMEVLLFGPSHLEQIHDFLIKDGKREFANLLQLRGYSNVRNLCMFIPHLLGSDAALLIDDDEVFEDPNFMSKAGEFIGKDAGGKPVQAVAGYYLQPDGDYHVKKRFRPWMEFWDQFERMNEAFDKIIGTEPRLKETPFVFGGNMIIHRNLFAKVPFDPNVPRGEDIDFLINARMFGFSFLLDNQLSIKHLPPSKTHPVWMRLREDIYRFVYERTKIESQKERVGMTRVDPEELDPYPGCFLKKDLEEKIEKACKLLSGEYLAQGDKRGSEEALRNIELARTDAVPGFDPFDNLCNLQRRWQELMDYTGRGDVSLRMREIIEGERK